MGEETINEAGAARTEHCACKDLGEHIAALFGVCSPDARQHLRNARIEILKAVRTVIDDRIKHLSHTTAKGTKVTVE
jgi:hypothetical protein